jgi:hypothetical protein
MQRPIIAALIFLAALALSVLTGASADPHDRSATNARRNPAGENQTATASIRAVLDDGFGRGQRGLQDARSHAQSADRGEGTDPRVPYAYGIVLLKHLKYRDALEQFEFAAAAGNGAYLPASKARIRTRFQLKQYDAGLKDAEELARRLRYRSFPWSDSKSRSGAHWLGRVIGYFALPKVKLVNSKTLSSREAVLRKLLGEDLQQAFDGGRTSIEQEYEEQQASLNLEGAALAAKRKDKLKQEADKIESRRQLVKDQAKTVNLTAKEWKNWLDEQLELTNKQLAVLKKDYGVLDAATNAISRQITEVQFEMRRLSMQAQFAFRQRRRLREDDRHNCRYEYLYQQLDNQLEKYHLQRLTLFRRSQGVLAQARSVVAKRSEAQQRYQNATGQLLKKDKTLQKWSAVLKQAKEKQAALAAKGSPHARALARRLVAISTYLPLDPQAQKQLLLEEIDPVH